MIKCNPSSVAILAYLHESLGEHECERRKHLEFRVPKARVDLIDATVAVKVPLAICATVL